MCEIINKMVPCGFFENENNIWFTLANRNTLICIDKNTDEMDDMIIDFGNATDRESYRRILKSGDELLLVPCNSDDVVVYDLKKSSFSYKRLNEFVAPDNEKYVAKVRFATAITNKDTAYMFGCFYPAIVKYDFSSKELFYYTEWVKEVDSMTKKDDTCGHFGRDCLIINDVIYAPLACTNGILRWNLIEDTYDIMVFDDGFAGYYSIACYEHSIWLSSRYNADYKYIVCWDNKQNILTNVELPDSKNETLYSLIAKDDKIYVIPESYGHIYVIDALSKEVSIADDIERLIYKEGEKCNFVNPTIFDSKLKLFNIEDGFFNEIELTSLEYEMKCYYDYKMKDAEYVNKYINNAAEKEVVLNENELSLESFLKAVTI